MRLEAAAVLVLLLAPLALGQEGQSGSQWTQLGGDAGHTRTIALPNAPLDVLGVGRVTQGVETLPLNSAFAAQAGGRVLALVGPDATGTSVSCRVVAFGERERPAVEGLLAAPSVLLAEDCPDAARIIGTSNEAGLAFLCRDGPRDVVDVRALDVTTGEVRWRVAPPPVPVSAPTALDQGDWACAGIVEKDRLVVTYSNNVEHLIVAYDLAGVELWRSKFAGTQTLPELPGVRRDPLPGDPSSLRQFSYATRIDGGYIFIDRTSPGILAWMDVDGHPVDSYVGGNQQDPASSEYLDRAVGVEAQVDPVAQGDLAAGIVSHQLVLVRVSDAQPVVAPLSFYPTGREMVWWREYLAVPEGNGVTVLNVADVDDTWTWKPPAPAVDALLATPEGELLAVSREEGAEGWRIVFSTIDLTRRVETARLHLPALPYTERELRDDGVTQATSSATVCAGVVCRSELVGLGGEGVLVMLNSGQYVVLGRAHDDRVPSVSVSDAYPSTGDVIGLRTDAPADATRIEVSWGDGTFATVEEGTEEHVFASDGRYDVLVTAHYADNRTATRAITVDVGGTPPVQLTAVQRAFSPENQELTFFLLGLAFTGGGVLVAAFVRRRRQSHLARETRKLHEIQDLAARDPVAGLAALEAHRRHLEDAHVRRKLDDAHYAHLDARTVRAMRATRLELLGPALNAMSPHFRDVLHTALDDGRISPGELRTLQAALARERIDEAERARVGALLAGWAR